VDELEPLLETIISEDFNVQAEDNSPNEVRASHLSRAAERDAVTAAHELHADIVAPLQVAKELINLYDQCMQGDFSIIEKLRQTKPAVLASTSLAAVRLSLPATHLPDASCHHRPAHVASCARSSPRKRRAHPTGC